MKITAEFNSAEEVQEFLSMFGQAPKVVQVTKTEVKQEVAKVTEFKQDPIEVEEPKVEAEITTQAITAEQVVALAAKKDEQPQEEPKKEAEVKVTKEMVRAIFTKVIKAGKQKEAKELTLKYGASKLGEVKEDDYVAIYKDAEELL